MVVYARRCVIVNWIVGVCAPARGISRLNMNGADEFRGETVEADGRFGRGTWGFERETGRWKLEMERWKLETGRCELESGRCKLKAEQNQFEMGRH